MITREDLTTLALFEGIDDAELNWLLANSRELHLLPGEHFVREGEERSEFYIVLEGELQITRLMNGRQTVLGTTPRGIIGNELSLLNEVAAMSTSQAIVPCRLLVLDLRAFREMFAHSPTLGARVLRVAAERMQSIAGALKQQEKMAALGKLSAGLAHELNNPAAAARRAAVSLRETFAILQSQALHLNDLQLSAAQLQTIGAFQHEAATRVPQSPPLSTLEQSDREDALSNWLAAYDVADPWEMAPTFVTAQITQQELEDLVAPLPAASVGPVLSWLNQALTAASLLDQIEQSSGRIAQLVGAIKSYTYMDRGTVQDVDLHAGLESTLLVLNHKLKRGVRVLREYDSKLPLVLGSGSELNQVWTNLIDNASDALDGKGTLRIITRGENEFAMVEIADDGPGIPPEVLPRIFEPFFTTKDVGIGTGLGLDIAYRIIKEHSGTIEVQSQPGQTRFIVRLPVRAVGSDGS